MGIRRIRRMQRQHDMAKSRRENGMIKEKERVRRDQRITGLLKKGTLPYTPSIMSWLCAQLDKPTSKIVQADVDRVLAAHASS